MRCHRLVSVAVLAAAVVSCGDDALSVQDVVGTYTATSFSVTPTGQAAIDVLAGGGSLAITLAGDGSTTGVMAIPASINGGTALLESMAGTFTLTGTTITFDQAADTFVRDVDFTVSGRRLHAAESLGSAAVDVTLARP